MRECKICHQSFSERDEYIHMKRSHPDHRLKINPKEIHLTPVQCEYCRNFMPEWALTQHIERKHKNRMKNVRCPHCLKSMSLESLVRHIERKHLNKVNDKTGALKRKHHDETSSTVKKIRPRSPIKSTKEFSSSHFKSEHDAGYIRKPFKITTELDALFEKSAPTRSQIEKNPNAGTLSTASTSYSSTSAALSESNVEETVEKTPLNDSGE